MNVFNRVSTVVTLLILILLAVVVLTVPREAVNTLAFWLSNLEASPLGSLARIVVSLLVIAIAVVLLYRETRRPARSRVIVGHVEGAVAELSVDAIAQRLRREAMAMPGVRSVQTTVVPRRNAVDVRLKVMTDPDVDVPAMAAEVARVARDNLEGKMGLRVGKLWVNIDHEAGSAPAPNQR